MTNENLVRTIEVTDEDGNVSTREIITYAGLLSKAHEQGLERIETKIVELPTEENGMTAISMAKVVTEKGVFIELGDANPGNVNAKIIPHIIRMSVTRAKARAMRDAVNVGVISLEELAEEFGNGNGGNGNGRGESSTDAPRNADTSTPMSASQRKYLFKLLSERGKTEDEAHTWLHQAFEVESLKDVTKKMASEMIDHLLSTAHLTEEQASA